MTRDQIIAWAREADQGHAGAECEQFGGGIVSVSTLEFFASLVAAHEREACAKVCEINSERWTDDRARYAALECAKGVRARKEKT